MEVLRISTVVDNVASTFAFSPLEVLRISTVVDSIFAMERQILWKC